MRIRSLLFTAIAVLALGASALAQGDSRVATDPEQMQVSAALTKEGYGMINGITVVNDQFKAFAKSKDAKNVEVTLDMKTLKVLSVTDVKP